ncbi:MAG: PEP-CTERM/exosortase system-associated acyltransferase [Candidatus Competibacteraceae bacterium]|nr:MAG: PEP-CTERM/exosortase system-associated acyltransferase [Candidatus Competibacteraceae bacterium]
MSISCAWGINLLETRNNLIFLFNKYFEIISADTQEHLQKCWRLRYQVYCLEAKIPGFHPEHYSEGLERDRYDEHSVHSLIVHRPSGSIAGTVRVILPMPRNLDARFPVEEYAGNAFYPDNLSLKNLNRSRLGEISRLIIAPEFRMRKGETLSKLGIAESAEYPAGKGQDSGEKMQRRHFPHTILGLFIAIVRMSAKHNLTYWYAGMEPVCARLLQTFGIRFAPISPVIDYYGSCRSYLGNISDVLKEVYRTNPEIWVLLTNDGALFPHSGCL